MVWRGVLVLLISFSLIGCGGQLDHNPKQHLFKNGDKAIVKGNQVSIYNKQNHLIQQSTFHSPTFLEARSYLTDIQQDLTAKHYADFLQGDVAYPLHVHSNGKTITYKTPVQLQAAFTKVFTPKILNAIIQQNTFRLMAHTHGISMTNGKVWFNKRGIYRIYK